MINIGIVDDHTLVRAGLKALLSSFEDFTIAGEAKTGREAIDLVRTTPLDVLILDLSMPGQSGMDAIALIRAKAPDVAILVLSAYPEEQYAVALIRQGASGYLNKDCNPIEIPKAIRTVASGRRYITPAVAEILVGTLEKRAEEPPHKQLTNREFQVLIRLAKGEAIGTIGEALSLSIKTVSTYRTKVMRKLALETNSDLTYYCLKQKLLD